MKFLKLIITVPLFIIGMAFLGVGASMLWLNEKISE